MTLKEIIKEALKLTKLEQGKLITALTDKVKPMPVKEFKEEICSFYKLKFKTDYYWVAKDYVALRQLINKIKAKLKEQNKAIDEAILLKSVTIYVQAVYNLENDWYRNNFSMTILNSHFNTLYVTITNNKQKGVSSSYREQVLRDLQS